MLPKRFENYMLYTVNIEALGRSRTCAGNLGLLNESQQKVSVIVTDHHRKPDPAERLFAACPA